jgi:hypothetical protein
LDCTYRKLFEAGLAQVSHKTSRREAGSRSLPIARRAAVSRCKLARFFGRHVRDRSRIKKFLAPSSNFLAIADRYHYVALALFRTCLWPCVDR